MRKIIVPSIVATLFLVGCGGSSSSSTSEKEVKVIDSYIIGAKVCDANGVCAETDENGIAKADFDLNSSLTSTGGYIDSNMNGIIDSNEIPAPNLKANPNSGIVTPLTDLIANGANPSQLAKVLNVSEKDLYKDPIETGDLNLAKAFQIVSIVDLKNGDKNGLISKINNYSKSTSATDLPPMGDGTSSASTGVALLANYTKSSLSDIESIQFVNNVLNSKSNNVPSLIIDTESQKESLIKYGTVPSSEIKTVSEIKKEKEDTKTKTTDIKKTEETTKTTVPTKTESTTTSVSTTTPVSTSTSGTDLPPMNGETKTTSTTKLEAKTDLPPMESDVKLKYIPTKEYNPSYDPLPKQYFGKIDGEFVEFDKIDDNYYKFKNQKLINIKTDEFNISKIVDTNLTQLFSDTNLTPNGNLNGTVVYNIENNNSEKITLTFKDVIFQVIGSKLSKISFDKTKYVDMNTTDGNVSKTIGVAKTFNNYDLNLTNIISSSSIKNEMDNNNTKHFNQEGIYNYSLTLNIGSQNRKIEGSYKLINTTPPTLSLDDTKFIVAKNSDINLTIGKANKTGAECKVEGISLSCKILSDKSVKLQGKTPDSEQISNILITLTDGDYKDSKSLNLEVLKPATNSFLSNWNLKTDGNYTENKVAISYKGSVGTTIDVNSSVSPLPTGSPENNVSVYIYKSKTDSSNYIKFVFDGAVYKSNDVFKIKNSDGVAIFRVGDITKSDNTIYFKK